MNVVPIDAKPHANSISIGKAQQAAIHLDLNRLIETRCLIQANSGGGKSTLMRLIIERAAGKLPFIILDWEGEFITLREKADVVLVGADGEIAADLRSAKLLARKLVELHASAVIDLSEMEPDRRRDYVKAFLDSLVNLPRGLWHSLLVCVDEAHQLCPEAGKQPASAQAVINLMSLGRKRGLAGILATQRLSKLHKDAVSECNNVFIGRTHLDIDQQRAGDSLGMTKADRLKLRDLAEGEFLAFGPALSVKGVARFQADLPQTRPPKAGDAIGRVIPKASEVVNQIVSQLADLPQLAEKEITDLADAQKRIHELERELKTRIVKPDKQVTQMIQEGAQSAEKRLREAEANHQRELADLRKGLTREVQIYSDENQYLRKVIAKIAELSALVEPPLPIAIAKPDAYKPRPIEKITPAPPMTLERVKTVVRHTGGQILPEGERKILTAIAQYPEGATREQLTILTAYKRSSRDTYIQRLSQKGYVKANGGLLYATEEGIDALGDFEPLPTGAELRDYWLARLPEGERRVLEVLIMAYPHQVHREAITFYKRSSRDTYIQRLSARRLVDTVGRGEVRANQILFD